MKRREVRIVGVILAAALVCWLLSGLIYGGDGTMVRVTVDGEEYGTWPFAQERVIDIDTDYGTNRIHIKDEAVYMEDADCPDRVCIRQGKIHTADAMIVCLPHRLTVQITGDKHGEQVDGISR